jgi:very-short-patch-repair endonuclease
LSWHVWTEIEGQKYCVDFVVTPRTERKGWIPIAVELDGHAFHERTPAQVSHRDSRDRALQRAGWKVFHLTA